MFGLGPWELIVIGLLLFVVFGAKRIPEIGKGLGLDQMGFVKNQDGVFIGFVDFFQDLQKETVFSKSGGFAEICDNEP